MNHTIELEIGPPRPLTRDELRALDAMDFGVKLSKADVDALA